MTQDTLIDIIAASADRLDAAGLAFGHGTSTAFDDAAYMALETLNLPPDALAEEQDRLLTPAERKAIDALITRRIETRKPAPYLVNRAWIQGLPFYVDERVIVPRSFIGELLCDEDGFNPPGFPARIKNVLDLCTGSGCLAILAAHLFPDAQVDAVDLSPDALAVAKRNVEESGMTGRVTLFEGDLFAPLVGRQYDLILTNPPYVDKEGMDNLPPEFRHEPAVAFDGGADGLAVTRRILTDAPRYLREKGGMLAEIGRCRPVLEEAFPKLPFLWLDTVESSGEVFWLRRKDF